MSSAGLPLVLGAAVGAAGAPLDVLAALALRRAARVARVDFLAWVAAAVDTLMEPWAAAPTGMSPEAGATTVAIGDVLRCVGYW